MSAAHQTSISPCVRPSWESLVFRQLSARHSTLFSYVFWSPGLNFSFAAVNQCFQNVLCLPPGTCVTTSTQANGCITYMYKCPSVPFPPVQLVVWYIRALDLCVTDTGSPTVTFDCQPSGESTFVGAATQTLIQSWFCFPDINAYIPGSLATLMGALPGVLFC